MSKQKITVAVTGLNAIDSPGPGVPVIRALKESKIFDCHIIGLSYEALEPGIYMHNLVDKTYQIPFPSTGAETLYTRLKQIQEKENIDVIIPNFDAELFSFIKLEKQLKDELGISMFLPTPEQFEARQKTVLYEFGKQNGVKVPYSKVISRPNEIPSLYSTEFTYPLVVKGKYYDAGIAYNPEQAVNWFNKISAKWGTPIILQQYVSGTEVNVTAIGDGKGNTIGAVPMRKMYITDKGKAWAGIAIEDENLMEITRKMLAGTKWRGGLELEIMKSKDGEYFLLEINPRFPAWVYLAVGCGQNHPEALLQLALGQDVKPFTHYDVGKLFIRYAFDQIVDLKEFEAISTQGEL